MSKQVSVHVHASRARMAEVGERLGLSGQALRTFQFALYEVEMTLKVDMGTGEAVIIECDGRKVEGP